MTKEQIYAAQLKGLGYYQEAFEPLIKELSQAERQRTRAQKAWSATAPPGGKPSFLDPHWAIIQELDRKILAYREALGLTPKALRRLMGSPEPPVPQDLISEKLSAIAARVGAYEVDVPKLDTGTPLSEAAAGGDSSPRDGEPDA
ncbi:MAG: hypothetical protein IKD61_05555 [Oscillospiraceae bacterium]|nr:hypothetical protein [Oscillospiraceae bacterium]